MTFPLDVDDEVLPFSGKWRTYVLITRCYSVGMYIHLFASFFLLMPLLDFIEDAYGIAGNPKLTCKLLQWILRDFMREAMCLRVC